MNFFQRALKNVTRRPSKSILLLITFFVIGNFVIIGLGVSEASENAKVLTRQKMRAVVTYDVDYDEIYEYVNSLSNEEDRQEFYNNYPRIRLSDVNALLEDERVTAANSLNNTSLYLDDSLDYVHLNNQVENDMGNNGQSCYIGNDGSEVCIDYIDPSIFVKANNFPNMIEIVEGSYTISEGRFYTKEEIDANAKVALVSSAFAEHNGLRVGDTITIYLDNPNIINSGMEGYFPSGMTVEDITLELEIIGIYNHNSPVTPNTDNYDYIYPYENPDNMILMPATTLQASYLKQSQLWFEHNQAQWPDDEYYSNPDNYPTMENSSYVSTTTLLLNDPLEVDDFVAEYSDNLADFMKITADNDEFNRLSRPLDTLSLYANFIVVLVVINAIVIISLVTALTLKTREYEIGVLLAIGASKLKVIGQFFVELAIVAIIGFSISIVSGSFVAGKVGETVLDYQISASGVTEENDFYYPSVDSIWDTDYTTDVTLDDLVAEYSVSISPIIIAEIYILGLGIVLISILVPSLMIMRFNPKRILMNQN